MANMNPVNPINGKKLIIACFVGAVVFTFVMGFGTFYAAKLIAPIFEKSHPKPAAAQTADSGTR